MARARALSSPRSEAAREEHWMLFRNRFPMRSGLDPTQDGGGPRVGMVEEGEEAGESLMTALAGVIGADMLILRTKVGMLRLSRVGGAIVGRGWSFRRREAALLDGWNSEDFRTSSSMFILFLLTYKSYAGE